MPRRPDYFRYAYQPDGSDFAARLNEAPKTESGINTVSFSETRRDIQHLKNGLNAAIEEKTNTDFYIAEQEAKRAAAERAMQQKEADAIAKANAETEISMRLAKIEADSLADPDKYKAEADAVRSEFADHLPQFEAQFRQGYVRVFNQKTQAEREKIAAETMVSFEDNARKAALATRNGNVFEAGKYNELAVGNIAYLERTGLSSPEALRTMRQSLGDSLELGGLQARYGLDFAGHLDQIYQMDTLHKTIEYMRRHFGKGEAPANRQADGAAGGENA